MTLTPLTNISFDIIPLADAGERNSASLNEQPLAMHLDPASLGQFEAVYKSVLAAPDFYLQPVRSL